jgi:hypothetical protein
LGQILALPWGFRKISPLNVILELFRLRPDQVLGENLTLIS